MTEDTWDPTQYERFRAERAAPFRDLLRLLEPEPDLRVVDLGCGTGDLTRDLHLAVGARETLGIDSSAAMLERTTAFAAHGLRFEQGDIARFTAPGLYDLVFSNAALQWVPDHPALLARLAAALTPRGQLAVQMPANFDHPSHVVIDEVQQEEPFRTALGDTRKPLEVLAPETYARLLARLGFREQHVRLQVYVHPLAGREDVVEWMRGTALTTYRRALPPALYERFLDRYRERLLPVLEDTRPYLFTFKRVLFWARR